MILVTGGAFQGKCNFAKTLSKRKEPVIAEGGALTPEMLKQADVITHFHLYIQEMLKQEKDAEEEVRKLCLENASVILTINEMGCGIVPCDAFDRKYREAVGRISCELAAQAEAVYRVSCGIGLKIK